MLYFSKEATNKDQKLKTKMMILFQDDESKGTEKVWQESGFFDEKRGELTISKVNFPKNTLVYANQASVSVCKDGEQAIYVEFLVIGQLMPVLTQILQLIWKLIWKLMKHFCTCLFIINPQDYILALQKN